MLWRKFRLVDVSVNGRIYEAIMIVEQSFRQFLSHETSLLSPEDWRKAVPSTIVQRVESTASEEAESADDYWVEALQFYDVIDIVSYKNGWSQHYSERVGCSLDVLKTHFLIVKRIRDRIAHSRNSSAFELQQTHVYATELVRSLGPNFTPDVERINEVCTGTSERAFVEAFGTDIVDSPRDNLPAPEYDEFIGRSRDITELRRIVTDTRFPVVGVTGIGGVGKTGLVRRVIDDIWLNPSSPFEYMIWVSAKEQQLTLTGVQNIVPSLRDYEDLLDECLRLFGFSDGEIDEPEMKSSVVRELLESASTLLIVDNLDTVTDQRVLRFILDPPAGTKILTTSRRGIGELERRYPLGPMSATESRQLARSLARLQGSDSIARTSDEILDKLLAPAEGLPLGIKWVIGQLALGKDLERVLLETKRGDADFLSFAFGNVFELLSEHAKKLICSLALMRDPPSAAIWSFVADVSADDFDSAVQELTLASLVQRTFHEDEDGGLESRYIALQAANSFANEALTRRPSFRAEASARLRAHSRQSNSRRPNLVTAHDGADGSRSLAMLSVRKARNLHRDGNSSEAIRMLAETGSASPQVTEVFTEWASIEEDLGNPYRADEILETAAQQNSDSIDVLLWWARLRTRSGDIDVATELYTRAASLTDSDSRVDEGFAMIAILEKNYQAGETRLISALDLADAQGDITSINRIRTELARVLVLWCTDLRMQGNLSEAGSRLDEAQRFVDEARATGSANARTVFVEHGITLERARVAVRRGDLQDGLTLVVQAAIEFPANYQQRNHNAWSLYERARILLSLKRTDEARTLVEQALSVAPEGSAKIRLTRLSNEFAL